MTILVYRDGVLAADTAQWACDIIVGHTNKVKKSPDGWLFASSGSVFEIQPYEEWLMQGRQGKPPRLKSTSVIAVSPEGEINIASELSHSVLWQPKLPWFVIGMGMEFATGCLASDKTAVETVALAIKHIPYVAGEVTSERLNSCGKHGKLRLPMRKIT